MANQAKPSTQSRPLRLSAQQQAVVVAVTEATAHVQVVARAGCGKTTTILAASACAVPQGPVAFFAFNKSIARELESKAPRGVNVQTLHSFGFRALRRAFPFVELDADKTFRLVTNLTRAGEEDLVSPVKRLVGLAKNTLSAVDDDALAELADEYEVDVNGDRERVFALVRQVLVESVPEPGARAVIDFDDMVWLPVHLNLSVQRFRWVFVDEAQDMNAVQHELVLRAARERGLVCFVGDPCQAIYAFRGAHASSMNVLASRLGSVMTLPLNQTRRCPSAVVDEAKKYVPDFEALPEAPVGAVSRSRDLDPVPGDMVLCRMNAPLVPVAFRLLRGNVPVKIQGREIGAGLVALIKRLKATDLDDLGERLSAWRVKVDAQLQRQYAQRPSKLEQLQAQADDKVATLLALATTETSVQGLVERIQRLFADVNDPRSIVLLSTVHKAKGLEAPKVWIIETPARGGAQEANIQYVAITRAKESLVFVPEETI